MMKPAARGLLAALALALAPALLPAAPAPTGKDKAASSPAEKVRQALDAPITLKVEQQSLKAVVDKLKEQGKISIVLEEAAIRFGLGGGGPVVDADWKDVKLKSALQTILDPFGLTYVVVGDTVVVTIEDVAVARQMKQRVNVECDKVEFGQALRQLSRETGANLVLDSRIEKEAKAPVSLELEDVPLETAVRLLSEMAGLKPVRIGNVLFITDKKNAAELRADPDLAPPGPVVPPGVRLYDFLAPPVVGPALPPPPPFAVEKKATENGGDKPGQSKDDPKKDGDK
jgi:hypothetical protein